MHTERVKLFECWLTPASDARSKLEEDFRFWRDRHEHFELIQLSTCVDGGHYVMTIIYKGLSDEELEESI